MTDVTERRFSALWPGNRPPDNMDEVRFVIVPLLALALFAACRDGDSTTPTPSVSPTTRAATLTPRNPTPTRTPKPTATQSPSASPTPSPAPTPSPTPVASAIDVSGSPARQGGFLIVRLLNQPADLPWANAVFAGALYPMLPSGDRWFAYVPLGQYVPVGGYTLEVTSESGAIASGQVTVAEGGFQFESIDFPPSSIDLLSDQAAIDAERAALAEAFGGFTQEKIWSGPWTVPAAGPITNAFGLQRSFNGGPYSGHSGTDIANDEGTPLVAAAAGVVTLAEELYLFGNAVVIDHGAGVFSSYSHMQEISVVAGQEVARGDLIGQMGETGFVSGAHVHWEAIVHGTRVDPMLFTQAGIEP